MSKVVRGLFAVAFFLVWLRKEQKTASCSSQSIQLQERERERKKEKSDTGKYIGERGGTSNYIIAGMLCISTLVHEFAWSKTLKSIDI